MEYRDAQSAREALHALAHTQGGYVTSKQAATAGYTRQHLDYHVSVGNIERVERGLFRVPTVPVSEHDDLIRLSLWSRGRDDRPQAVVSHLSALALHDLSDILPGQAHITVPRTFRKAPPPTCVLHRGELLSTEVEEFAGFRATSPLRTLMDIAEDRTISTEHVVRAVLDAFDRGLVIPSRLHQAAARLPGEGRLTRVLESAGS